MILQWELLRIGVAVEEGSARVLHSTATGVSFRKFRGLIIRTYANHRQLLLMLATTEMGTDVIPAMFGDITMP